MENNFDILLYYVGVYFAVLVSNFALTRITFGGSQESKIFDVLTSLKSQGASNSSAYSDDPEINALESKIARLKEEAENYHTQDGFVTYSKMQRQISRLEKEVKLLEASKTKGSSGQKIENQSINNNIKNYNSILTLVFSQVGINIIFMIINVTLFSICRKHSYIISHSATQLRKNLIGHYFYNQNEGVIKIPFTLILFSEYLLVNIITKAINK